MTRKESYDRAYKAGEDAACVGMADPQNSVGESNAWYEWRDDVLGHGLAQEDRERAQMAFFDGYRDMSDREPD